MTARTVGMGAPFRWLMKSLDVGRRQPRALMGGFAILMAIALVPSVIQIAVQYGMQPSPSAMVAVYGAVMLLSLVLMPPLFAGGFRLIHACETGQPASATDVLAGYRDMPTAVRMVLTGLLLSVTYLAIAALLLLLPGGQFFGELMAVAMTTPPGGQPDMTGLEAPSGMLLWMLAAFFAVMIVGNAYLLAFAQAALADRGPVAATTDGYVAALKNILPLLGFALAVLVLGFIVLLLVVLVLGVLVGLLAVASPVLAVVVAVPVYLGLMLVMYVVMFGFYYHAWRDIFGEPVVEPGDSIAA